MSRKKNDDNEFEYDDEYLGRGGAAAKPSLLLRIADSIIPLKGDSIGEMIRKIIFIVSFIIFAVSMVLIAKNQFSINSENKRGKEMADIKSQIEHTGEIPLDDSVIEEIRKKEPKILDQYMVYYNNNPDTIGFIEIPGIFAFPVMQTTDNDFYLTHNIDKEKSSFGAIFADYHVPFTADSRPNNTVLYGHNIRSNYTENVSVNDGYERTDYFANFAKITRYYPQVEGHGMYFYNQNPIINFDTIYEKGVYKIFAGIHVNIYEADGSVFDYYRRRVFQNKDAFYDFLGNVMDRSVFFTEVDLEYGDEIITLSTCYPIVGNNYSDKRFVLFARRVRDGETPEVDVTKAMQNPSPLYMDSHYRINGGSWGGRNWDTSKIKGFDEYVEINPDAPIAVQGKNN